MNIFDITSLISAILGIVSIIVLLIVGRYTPKYIYEKKIGAIVIFLFFVINLLCIILPAKLKDYTGSYLPGQIILLFVLCIFFFVFFY
jgi:hypothetical protein